METLNTCLSLLFAAAALAVRSSDDCQQHSSLRLLAAKECDVLSRRLYDYADADFSGDVSSEEVLAVARLDLLRFTSSCRMCDCLC